MSREMKERRQHKVHDRYAADRTWVKLPELPMCSFCEQRHRPNIPNKPAEVLKARYDGKTKFGPWAYMCPGHFVNYGVGVGVGKGQYIVLPEEHPPRLDERGLPKVG